MGNREYIFYLGEIIPNSSVALTSPCASSRCFKKATASPMKAVGYFYALVPKAFELHEDHPHG